MAKKLTPYFAFRIYMSVKAHYQSRYDLPARKWKFMNPARHTFDNWNGKQLFKALVDYKITSMRDWVSQCIVMFKTNPSITYDEVLTEFEFWREKTLDWEAHIGNMPFIFKNESTELMKYMFDDGMNFGDKFGVWLLRQFQSRYCCVETFIIFKKMLKIGLDGNPNYEYLYKDKYGRYELLLSISTEKYRDILTKVIINEKQRRSIM